jgi:hypothetical protein
MRKGFGLLKYNIFGEKRKRIEKWDTDFSV